MNEKTKQMTISFPVDIVKKYEKSGDRILEGYCATTDLDLADDIITAEAFKKSEKDLEKNSTVLYNHDMGFSIGRVLESTFDRKGLFIKVLISKANDVEDIWQKITEGVLNKFSIRLRIIDKEVKFVEALKRAVTYIKEMLLLEASVVTVPMNPEARSVGWYISKSIEFAEKGGNIEMSGLNIENADNKSDKVTMAETTKTETKEQVPAVETKIEEVKTEAAVEQKLEETKTAEVKTEEVKTEEVKTETVGTTENKVEPKTEETKTVEVKTEEVKTETIVAVENKVETKAEEIKTAEAKTEEVKTVETKADVIVEVKTDEIKSIFEQINGTVKDISTRLSKMEESFNPEQLKAAIWNVISELPPVERKGISIDLEKTKESEESKIKEEFNKLSVAERLKLKLKIAESKSKSN